MNILAVNVGGESVGVAAFLAALVGVLSKWIDFKIKALEKRDDDQQATIDKQGRRIRQQSGRIRELEKSTGDLTAEAKTERELKHECRGRLWGAWMIIQLYRKAFRRLEEDTMEEPTAPIDPSKTAALNTSAHEQQFPGEPPRKE